MLDTPRTRLYSGPNGSTPAIGTRTQLPGSNGMVTMIGGMFVIPDRVAKYNFLGLQRICSVYEDPNLVLKEHNKEKNDVFCEAC